MYQKYAKYDHKESAYRKAEKEKQIKLFEGLGGGIYRIEDLAKKSVKDIHLKHFLRDPTLNLFEMIRNNTREYFTQEKIKLWKVYKEDKINKKYFMKLHQKICPPGICFHHRFPV